MNYIDISPKKILPVSIMLGVLVTGVALTFSWKESTYGSTPFFHAAGLMWSRAVSSITYSFERGTLLASLGFPSTITANVHGDDRALAVPVLVYHRIVAPGNEVNKGNLDESDGYNITIDAFKEQMETLHRAGWKTVRMSDLQKFLRGEISLPEKSFVLTFDDGTKDSYYPVDPVLQAFGYNAVEYVIVKDTAIQKSTYYLSPAEIHNMLASGRWEIGSHSNNAHVSYPITADNKLGHFYSDLLWLPEERRIETPEEFTARVYEDLQYSHDKLASTYQVDSNTMAFPFGNYGQDTQNFPGAQDITLQEAKKVYGLVVSQVRGGMFTFNYPDKNAFHAVRIEPTPEWSGGDVLLAFTNGMPKDLPYSDTFAADRGWVSSWGDVQVSGGDLYIASARDTAGASVILDGTYLWNDVSVVAEASWKDGYAVVLADVREENTNRACTFSEGKVRLQDRTRGVSTLLGEYKDERIEVGRHSVGISTQGSTVSCLYDGESVLVVENVVDYQGGIGLETWAEKEGAASVTVSDVMVTKSI